MREQFHVKNLLLGSINLRHVIVDDESEVPDSSENLNVTEKFKEIRFVKKTVVDM